MAENLHLWWISTTISTSLSNDLFWLPRTLGDKIWFSPARAGWCHEVSAGPAHGETERSVPRPGGAGSSETWSDKRGRERRTGQGARAGSHQADLDARERPDGSDHSAALCGGDPLPGKRQRVPRRWAVGLDGPEPGVGEVLHSQGRLMEGTDAISHQFSVYWSSGPPRVYPMITRDRPGPPWATSEASSCTV